MGNFSTSMYPVRPPEPVQPLDPLDAFARATELKTAMARAQMIPVEIQQRQQELQINQQKIDQAQRAQRAQQALGQALSANTKFDDAGSPTTDHTGVIKSLADQGFGPEALKYDADRRADLANAVDVQQKQTEVNGKKAAQFASLAGSVPKVDWTEADPQILQTRVRQSTAAVKIALDQAVNMGLIDAPTAKQMEAQPYTPDLEKQIEQIAQQGMTSKDQHEAHLNDLKELREKLNTDSEVADRTSQATERGATTAKTAEETQQLRMQAASTLLAGAKTPQQYRRNLSLVRPELRSNFPAPEEWDAATAPDEIRRLGMTPDQQSRADQAAAKPDKPTYTGDLRAALVAIGAKNPDAPTADEAAKALDRIKPAAGEKPVSKATLASIESRKTKAIRDSKAKLDKDLAAVTFNGKVDPKDQGVVDQAWEEHIQRLQDAQLGYESELTAATGADVGHNDWADRLKAPGQSVAAPGAPAKPSGAPAAAPAAALPPRPPSIPATAKAQYNPAQKKWRYSTDGGQTWQQPPGQ